MPKTDVIIPTLDARKASFKRLTDSLPASVNVIPVLNPPTCGEGWMRGLKKSKAPYVALIADDLEFIDEEWLDICQATVDEDLLPCPRVFTPEGRIESQGGDMTAQAHLLQRPRADRSPTDFTTVPFCSREQIDRIGMIPTQYCCDVWVSYRGRQLGYETVLRHGFDIWHHQEQAGRGAGMEQSDRDAMDTQILVRELEKFAMASHVEVLRLALALLEPKLVLELGAGEHSTSEILKAESVDTLISLEDDPDWADRVDAAHPGDERLRLQRVDEVSESVPEDLHTFDLIFVDNGSTPQQRERAIREVLEHTDRPPVLIHDAEHPTYRRIIEELQPEERRVVFSGLNPQTAVCW